MNNDQKYSIITPRIDHVCEICKQKIEKQKKCGFRTTTISWRYYGREYVHLTHLSERQFIKKFRTIPINDVKTFFQL